MSRKVLVVVGVMLLSLASCCGVCMVAELVTDAPGGGSSELNGRYECQAAGAVYMNGMLVPQYQPTGMWFVIDGDRYTCSGGDGAVSFDTKEVRFTGGGYDAWRGERSDGAITFRGDGTSAVRELRCAQLR